MHTSSKIRYIIHIHVLSIPLAANATRIQCTIMVYLIFPGLHPLGIETQFHNVFTTLTY